MITATTHGTSQFKDDVRRWMIKKDKTVYDWLTLTAGVVTKDAMRFTPPTAPGEEGKTAAESNTWQAQKRAGQNRIKIEVTRLFPVLSLIHIIRNPIHARAAKYIQKYIESRNWKALHTMLADFGIPVPLILERATSEAHKGARDPKTGRVKAGVRYPVIDKASVPALIKTLLPDVGKLKAGWMAGVTTLGVKGIPKWISGHSTFGACNDQRNRAGDPFVAVSNFSPNQGGIDTEKIVRHAVEINGRKMESYLKHQLEGISHK